MTNRASQDYRNLVQSKGVEVELRGPWASCGHSLRKQGWKLHLSAVPANACDILSLVAPILQAERIAFKFAHSETIIRRLNEGALGETQVGKFITVYPDCDNLCLDIAERLVAITSGFEGPDVISDIKLGGIVFARYGGINPEIMRDRLGQVFSVIELPDGSKVRDAYSVPFSCPPGIKNPFEQSNFFPSATKPRRGKKSQLFGPGYRFLDILKQGPKGRVFLVLDVKTQDRPCLKIIKEGRKHCLSDPHGRDIRVRLQKQERLHRILYAETNWINRT